MGAISLRRVGAALDGFAEGRDAAALASAFASMVGAQVRLAAVHPDPLVVMPPGSRWHDLRKDAEQLLRRTRDELSLPLTTPIIVETDWSVPRALDRIVRREALDLLVLGSSRRGPAGQVQIGRVTRQLLGRISSALAVAPRGYAEKDGRPPIRRIGVGYDDGAESDAALSLAATLAAASGAELIISAVVDNRLPLVGWSAGREMRTELWNTVLAPSLDALQQQARGRVALTGCDAEVRVSLGNPVETLQRLSSEVDLVVIGSRRWGALAHVVLGSAGESLMHGAVCPVLVAPRRP